MSDHHKNEAPGAATPKASKMSKRHTILSVLAHGESLNRFEAERHRDHVLNTTISEIGRLDGIIVSRKVERFTNSAGHRVRCNRYWLEPDQRAKALQIIGEKSS